jgi:hypothetical protein
MEVFGPLILGLTALVLLAVASMRYGVDSRDGFRARNGELASWGIVWDTPPPERMPPGTVKAANERPSPPIMTLDSAPDPA